VEGVKGLSVTLAYAVYAVRWRRDDVRLVVVRCVLAVPEQTQIEVRACGCCAVLCVLGGMHDHHPA